MIILVITIAVSAGCGSAKPGSTPQAAVQASAAGEPKAGGKIVVYTSVQPEQLSSIEPKVKAALPDVEVEWFQAGTEKLIAKMAAEMESGKVNADVLMVADPSYYIYLKSKDMLLPYKPNNISGALGVQDPDGYYNSVRVINAVIGYNTKQVKKEDAPKSFADLTDPKWKGKLGMPDPTQSGSAFDTVAALQGKYGWDYFKSLKNNGIVVFDGQGTLEKKIESGEVAVGLILEMNILTGKSKGEPIDIVYPEDGIGVFPSPIGIIKTTGNPVAAKALVDWWFTKEGQQAITGGAMHSVFIDVAPPAGAPRLSEFIKRAFPMDWAKLSTEIGKLKDDFNATMGR